MKIPNVSWKKTLEEDSTPEVCFGVDGILDGQLEQRVTGNLILVAPLIDTYLHEVGSTMKNKMGRGRGTSLQSSVPVLLPWQAIVYIIQLPRVYGAFITAKTKNIEKVITVTVYSKQCGRKLCNTNWKQPFGKDKIC